MPPARMIELRSASVFELAIVANWITSAESCLQWAGTRVTFPIQLNRLSEEIGSHTAESWRLTDGHKPVAFGQIFSKADNRQHLARIIVAPTHSGHGFGRELTDQLLRLALAKSPTRVSLNVFADNIAAMNLYLSLGFRPADRPQNEVGSTSQYMDIWTDRICSFYQVTWRPRSGCLLASSSCGYNGTLRTALPATAGK